jgi:hypothetical protein
LAAFYAHQARHGVDIGELLTTWGPAGRRSGWRPFLHHIAKGKPQARRTIALKAPTKLPRVLTVTHLAATTSRWLVVLDDLTDPTHLQGRWPPNTPTGQVLVTTRRRDAALSTHGTVVAVGLFTDDEAHTYVANPSASTSRTGWSRRRGWPLTWAICRWPWPRLWRTSPTVT